MRPLIVLLAITSTCFAATTAYFARELAAERARPSAQVRLTTGVATADRAASPDNAGRAIATEPAGNPPATGPVVIGALSASPVSEADMKRMQAEFSKNMLARLADPEGREEMRAEHRAMLRNQYPRLDRYLGLTAEEHRQLLDLMADQQIGMQERSARCAVDPACAMGQMTWSGDDQAADITRLIGEERARKFDTYRNTMGEREAITQLRSRLSDSNRLGDDAAESLVAALADERAAMHRESAAHGGDTFSFGLGAGVLFAPAEGSFESRYEAARQNSQRLRDRAAQHLNAEQMRAFNEMQDELLLSLRGLLRQKEQPAPGPGTFFVTQ